MRGVMTILAVSLLLFPMLAHAAEPPVPIEGKLLLEYFDTNDYLGPGTYHAYFLEGTSDNVVEVPWALDLLEISPDATRLVYDVRTAAGPYQAQSGEIWVANLDGTDAINLTEAAGLGGVNCCPSWSPDGSMIAFQHAEPALGQITCEAGFQVWLMDAAGTNPRQWISSPSVSTMSASWAPDGYRIACEGPYQSCLIGDVTGGNLRTIPGVNGRDVEWSKDGAKISYTTLEPATVAGEPGVWERLCLSEPDGTDVQVLVEQFLSDSDLNAHISTYGFEPSDWDWLGTIRWVAGPRKPRWSPLGDRLAFIAALPFDPSGPAFLEQLEVWVYDLASGEATRLTYDTNWYDWLCWGGPNTFSSSPEVTVGNATVTFAAVTAPGLTTIVRDNVPPEVPTDSQFDYAFYELNTTAEVTGPISICMTYTDEEVPPAAEADLAILHWDGEEWVDITTSHDTDNNIICGETTSLSSFALHGIRRTKFPDVPAWGYGADGLDPYWAYYYVMGCVEAQIVNGYEDGTYRPTTVVTRDQMAVYIARSLAGGDVGVPEFAGTPSFSDVPASHWAVDYVEYAVEAQVVGGYEDGTYQPTWTVDRGQMAVFIARALAGGDDNVPDYTGTPFFPDVPADFWAFRHVEYIRAAGVTQGFDDGLYHPEYAVTRDQMAVYVAKAFGLLG